MSNIGGVYMQVQCSIQSEYKYRLLVTLKEEMIENYLFEVRRSMK